jgi:hypothetical protein
MLLRGEAKELSMEKIEALEQIKQFVMEHELPRADVALFGVKCPYCGKSDRIRQLETADELNGALQKADIEQYKLLRQSLVTENATLGICKFCFNALRLDLDQGLAEPLYD